MQHTEPDHLAGREPSGPAATGLVAWAVRTAAAAGLLCILATQFLAGVTTPDPAAALKVARAATGLRDPETTGSIGGLRTTRLDPCVAANRAPKP